MPLASRAFRDAIAALRKEERTLLRYHYLDGLGIDPLSLVLGVHRVTAARRLNKARSSVVQGTRALLTERLRVGSRDLESILRLIESQLDISVRHALRTPPALSG
jgi:RNA polymerase sigma-70 factor (ECF subfamily)